MVRMFLSPGTRGVFFARKVPAGLFIGSLLYRNKSLDEPGQCVSVNLAYFAGFTLGDIGF